jgi:hypothetical protein
MDMKDVRRSLRWIAVLITPFLVVGYAAAQTCYTADDMEPAVRSTLQNTAQQYFNMVQTQNYAGLKSAAIPAVANSFDAINNAIGEHRQDLQGQAQTTGMFILDASSASGTLQRAEFYCGIFNSPNRVGFLIPNLPPGRYAFVSESLSGGRTPVNVNFVLQQNGNQWQLAGLTIDPQAVAGHDSNWYLTQARAFHQKGANLSAYLYYWMAWKLAAPSEIEYTAERDQIADEMAKSKPANWPTSNAPMTLSVTGKTFNVTTLFPEAVPSGNGGDDLDVIVKYRAISNINDTAAAFADNMAIIKALLAQYPELRSAFTGVVARAVAPTGADYGTVLAMKDVK